MKRRYTSEQVRKAMLAALSEVQDDLTALMANDPDVPIGFALVVEWCHHEDFETLPQTNEPVPYRGSTAVTVWPGNTTRDLAVELLQDGIKRLRRDGAEDLPLNPPGDPPEAA